MRLRDWRLKATAQRAFSAVPGGHHVNYLLQRAVGGLPVSDASLAKHIETGRSHLAAIEDFGVDPRTAISFEFGAGYDLHMPLIQRALGLGEQHLVDIRPVVRGSLVLDVARRLRQRGRTEDGWVGIEIPSESLADVLAANHLRYDAPADARATTLPTCSVDAVLTTSTLEHIPRADLVAIYAECRRLLKPDGVMSMVVDHADHWSYFDPTLSPYDFLRYDEQEWAKWSPALMYQNRLRHDDHVGLLEEAGFSVTVLRTAGADADGIRALQQVPLAAPFAGRDPAGLAITTSHLVATLDR